MSRLRVHTESHLACPKVFGRLPGADVAVKGRMVTPLTGAPTFLFTAWQVWPVSLRARQVRVPWPEAVAAGVVAAGVVDAACR